MSRASFGERLRYRGLLLGKLEVLFVGLAVCVEFVTDVWDVV